MQHNQLVPGDYMARNILAQKKLSDGTILWKEPGKKGQHDFVVKAKPPGRKRGYTPKHAHFLIDFYGKLCYSEEVGKLLFDLITDVYKKKPANQVLNSIDIETKRKIDNAPGYSLEFILHALEWIFEQEDINYPPPDYKGRAQAYQMFVDVMNGMHPVDAMKRAGLRI